MKKGEDPLQYLRQDGEHLYVKDNKNVDFNTMFIVPKGVDDNQHHHHHQEQMETKQIMNAGGSNNLVPNSLPQGWEAHVDESKMSTYYFHHRSVNETTWETSASPLASKGTYPSSPSGWKGDMHSSAVPIFNTNGNEMNTTNGLPNHIFVNVTCEGSRNQFLGASEVDCVKPSNGNISRSSSSSNINGNGSNSSSSSIHNHGANNSMNACMNGNIQSCGNFDNKSLRTSCNSSSSNGTNSPQKRNHDFDNFNSISNPPKRIGVDCCIEDSMGPSELWQQKQYPV